MMQAQDREALRRLAERARDGGEWELQTSSNWHRIGSPGRDGNILRPDIHPANNHLDLSASPGVLEYIVSAQPATVIALLDRIDQLEQALANTSS